jgi:hypothetical protein
MKKFSIKTLIVLMLVLVLCFSLVACGEKKDDNNDGGGNGGGDTSCTRHVDRRPKDGKCDNCGADMGTSGGGGNEGGGNDGGGDTGYGAAQFFQGLWDSAATILRELVGHTPIHTPHPIQSIGETARV